MALSEYEQRVLAEMEQHLRADDPRLASSMASKSRGIDIRRLSLGILGFILGLIGLLAGVATSQTWIGIIGFIVMLASAVWAMSAKTTPAATRVKRQQKPRGTFMQRQEDRWNNRRR
ncbi:MAG: DUF3040 domain-containing protein [Bowdeniella nasicola]|nr:DUF3040 domain-containing protein [Bowdeniella nasicola]